MWILCQTLMRRKRARGFAGADSQSVNGADGIAVGMATSIPPHNLGRWQMPIKAYMKNNDISVKGLMRYLKGPDFPTGGIVVNKDDLLKIYETGTGKIRIRGKVEIEN